VSRAGLRYAQGVQGWWWSWLLLLGGFVLVLDRGLSALVAAGEDRPGRGRRRGGNGSLLFGRSLQRAADQQGSRLAPTSTLLTLHATSSAPVAGRHSDPLILSKRSGLMTNPASSSEAVCRSSRLQPSPAVSSRLTSVPVLSDIFLRNLVPPIGALPGSPSASLNSFSLVPANPTSLTHLDLQMARFHPTIYIGPSSRTRHDLSID
jgi:hypothetical protein